MSDFDKEAEREKLREKFARDEEKRKSTQRMSELLLKGATMTNKHCNNCGDPLFRYSGEEFCANCQNAQVSGGQIQVRDPNAVQDANAAGDGADAAATPADAADAEAEQSTEAGNVARDDATATADAAQTAQAEQSARHSTEIPVSSEDRATDSGGQKSAPTAASASAGSSADALRSAAPGRASDDLDGARASLRRTVTKYAEAAESTDDPRRAQELLAAAREAAETLAALRR